MGGDSCWVGLRHARNKLACSWDAALRLWQAASRNELQLHMASRLTHSVQSGQRVRNSPPPKEKEGLGGKSSSHVSTDCKQMGRSQAQLDRQACVSTGMSSRLNTSFLPSIPHSNPIQVQPAVKLAMYSRGYLSMVVHLCHGCHLLAGALTFDSALIWLS